MRSLSHTLVGTLVGGLAVSALLAPQAALAACEFLEPIGGSGPVVKKRVERPKGPLGSTFGRTNWNTDFTVGSSYNSFKLFFTPDSTDKGTYPIEAYLKFTDGSNLRVVDEKFTPTSKDGKMFGPFKNVQGKRVSQVNFKVGTAKEPGATGFSYRISVQGCR